MKTVFVIVVTYNGSKWIDKCLGSLRISKTPVKIIVVDNNSTDGTQKIIRDKFPKVELIESESNLGFGAGNNLGIRLAMDYGAEYVFLLNQDAWIDDNTLEKLLEVAENNTDFGIVSPIHLNGSGELLDKYFLNHILLDNRKLFSDLLKKESKSFYQVSFVNAAAWLVSISCIKKVGLFDAMFFHYGEDENFVERCKYFGYKIGIVLDSFVYHDREDIILKKEAKNEFDLKYIKYSWLVKMTNINIKDWSKRYNRDLIVFLSKIASRSVSNKINFIYAYNQLRKLKKEIIEARNRMNIGFDAY